MSDASPQVVYASLNRRLMAAMVDTIIIMAVIAPMTSWIVTLIAGGDNLQQMIDLYLAEHREGVIKVSDMVQYLDRHNAVTPWVLSQIISIAMAILYCVCFWMWFSGATPGKMLLRIQVLDAVTYKQISLKQAIFRALGYSTCLIGFIVAIFRHDWRTLHDLIAGTAVLVKPIE